MKEEKRPQPPTGTQHAVALAIDLLKIIEQDKNIYDEQYLYSFSRKVID